VPARGGNRADRLVHIGEGGHNLRDLEQEDRHDDSDDKREADLLPGDRGTALTDEPGDREQRDDAQGRLKLQHAPADPKIRGGL
jgi:hypothetical protein